MIFVLGDLSASETTEQALIDAKIKLIIDTQDPSIVDDLRQHNPGRPPKYEKFWEECRRFLNDEVGVAIDDRRHGELTHLAKAISVKIYFSKYLRDVHRTPQFLPSNGYGYNFGQPPRHRFSLRGSWM